MNINNIMKSFATFATTFVKDKSQTLENLPVQVKESILNNDSSKFKEILSNKNSYYSCSERAVVRE